MNSVRGALSNSFRLFHSSVVAKGNHSPVGVLHEQIESNHIKVDIQDLDLRQLKERLKSSSNSHEQQHIKQRIEAFMLRANKKD